LYEREKDIPLILLLNCTWIIKNGLNKKGIFRESALITTINKYQTLFDSGIEVSIPDTEDPNVPACIIKQWLRGLPDPLLTYERYSKFIDVFKLSTLEEKLETLRDLVNSLPKGNKFVLEYLIKFFSLVSKNQSENLMTEKNLGIIIGPNFLKSKEDDLNLVDNEASVSIVELFLTHADDIFKDVIEEKKLYYDKIRENEKIIKQEQEEKEKELNDFTSQAVLLKTEGNKINSNKIAPGETVKEGMVKFKLKSWHTYYAVLKFKHLSFYRSKEKNSNSLRGNIVLKDCTVGNSKIKKKIVLQLVWKEKCIILLRVMSRKKMNGWKRS